MEILLIHGTLRVEVSQATESETPLRSFSQLAHDQEIPFCILTITINIRDIPATKISGLNTIAIRLLIVKSFPIHQSPVDAFLSKTWSKMRKGAHMINIHNSPTLRILATRRSKSPTVKKNRRKNWRAKPKVIFSAFVVMSEVRYFWKLNTDMPR